VIRKQQQFPTGTKSKSTYEQISHHIRRNSQTTQRILPKRRNQNPTSSGSNYTRVVGEEEGIEMNIEQTKEAIRVMQAFVDGDEVRSMRTPTTIVDDPHWNWGDDTKTYHIKPTPVLRPWTADEVPLGSIMRTKGLEGRCIIIDTETSDDRSYWLHAREHSIDNGKTWLPCGVMEESK